MTKKKKHKDIDIEELLITNIISKIEIHHRNASSTINEAMMTLFWKFGSIIEQQVDGKCKTEESVQRIRRMADFFEPQFGSYFSYNNISLMWVFAKRCSSVTLNHISPYISWEYLPVFLDLKTEEAWVFYARLIYQKSLTPIQLSNKIAENSYEKEGLFLKYPEYPFFDLFLSERPVLDPLAIKSYFDGEKSIQFRELFEPGEITRLAFHESISPRDVEIFEFIYDSILTFQNVYNNLLNIRFNYLFWDIGYEIKRLFKTFSYISERDTINRLAEALKNRFAYNFDYTEITFCINFNDQYADRKLLDELISCVQWEHIKVLLSVKNRDYQLFYARLVLERGLTGDELQLLLVDNSDESSIPVISLKEEARSKHGTEEKQSPTIRRILNVKYNSLEDSNYSIHDLNRNIFKNRDLIKLLKAM